MSIAADGQQPAWIYAAVIGGLAVLVTLLWALNRLIMRLFPATKNYGTAGGNALMRLEAQFLPGREHVMEARERDDAEEDDEGEPPRTGGNRA
jgi:hypothetical protein